VTPSSGGGPIQTFTFQYSDAAGASDISQGWQVFANQFGTVQACVVGVVTWSWTILLWNDAGTAAAGTAQLGSGTILENSQCRVHAATSSASASGNTLTIVLSIEFKANYSGLKNIYAYAASWGAGWSSTVDVGDWTARSRIDSLSPSSANIEQTITINGLGFAALPNGPSVTVNGIVASVSSWSNTAIQAVVPPTTSGPVVVSTQGQASNSQTLTVLQGPVISGLSPWWGPVDTSVVISGSHFGTSGTVRFWCPSSPSCPTAQTTAWSDGSITAIVPAGATTGLVTVTRAGLSSNGVPFVVGDEGEEYVHTDAIGSVRMVTGHDGYVLSRHDYLPFGDEWPPGGTPTRVGFAGTERDGETETASWTALNYLGARHEHAASGRFTAVDPGHVNGRVGDPQSWNGYAYALNNPLRFFDPGGTQAVPIPVPGIDVVVKGGLSEVMLQAIDRAHSITITLGEAVSNLVDTVTGTEVAQGPGLGEADIPPKEPVVHPVVMTAVVVVTTRRGGKQLARSAPRSWSAARGAYWKKFGPNGKAPTREVLVRDTRTGQMYRRTETKELHHKVQRQHGGTNDESNLIEAWPTEHGAIDPHRHPGYEVIRVLSGP
jgi:RHS repeat-associated protein